MRGIQYCCDMEICNQTHPYVQMIFQMFFIVEVPTLPLLSFPSCSLPRALSIREEHAVQCEKTRTALTISPAFSGRDYFSIYSQHSVTSIENPTLLNVI